MTRVPDTTDTNGQLKSISSTFRSHIPSKQFPVEAGRYVLYVNDVCPWAHRAVIARKLKGLENVLEIVEVDARDPTHGWYFSGRRGPDRDPHTGARWLKELYLEADRLYNGRINIPILWDKKSNMIVNNESGDILRIVIESFDSLLPPERREKNKDATSLIPLHLRTEIEELNSWVYDTINNGVYKVGFAKTQAAYNEHVKSLFQSLDRLELRLSQSGQPFLFGEHITEPDIRLFTTLIRFDVAYYTIFKCNMKMIRLDYPYLHNWLRRLYWNEDGETGGGVFKETTHFDVIKRGYASVTAGNGVIPIGPVPPIMPL